MNFSFFIMYEDKLWVILPYVICKYTQISNYVTIGSCFFGLSCGFTVRHYYRA